MRPKRARILMLLVLVRAGELSVAAGACRHVILPQDIAKNLPKNLLSEREWRQLGVQQSRGWVHYGQHKPEPHILLMRRPMSSLPEHLIPK